MAAATAAAKQKQQQQEQEQEQQQQQQQQEQHQQPPQQQQQSQFHQSTPSVTAPAVPKLPFPPNMHLLRGRRPDVRHSSPVVPEVPPELPQVPDVACKRPRFDEEAQGASPMATWEGPYTSLVSRLEGMDSSKPPSMAMPTHEVPVWTPSAFLASPSRPAQALLTMQENAASQQELLKVATAKPRPCREVDRATGLRWSPPLTSAAIISQGSLDTSLIEQQHHGCGGSPLDANISAAEWHHIQAKAIPALLRPPLPPPPPPRTELEQSSGWPLTPLSVPWTSAQQRKVFPGPLFVPAARPKRFLPMARTVESRY